MSDALDPVVGPQYTQQTAFDPNGKWNKNKKTTTADIDHYAIHDYILCVVSGES